MEDLKNPQTVEEAKRDGALTAILYLLQENLEAKAKEVDRSYHLLKIGEKTDFTKELESFLDSPLGAVSSMTHKIDDSIKSLVDKYVTAFFKLNKEKIAHVYKSYTSINDLYYSIVLCEDNSENRDEIFSFFNLYDQHEVSRKYPVYFQFTPIELAERIKVRNEISLV